MLQSVRLPNKPLCMIENSGQIYIGDARGNVLGIEFPYTSLRLVKSHSAPVSAICFYKNRMICGTWDGTVCDDKLEIKLGKDPVKCMAVFEDRIFVSIDKQLILIDENMNVVEKYDTFNKIYSMDVFSGRIYFGMGTGMMAIYSNKYEEYRSTHESSILCIKGNLTGSSDCTVRDNENVIYSGSGWIRSIWNHNLFVSGKEIIENMIPIYSHDDEAMCVIKIQDTILSIGLDFCLKVFNKELNIDKDEEQRLMDILNS